MQNRRNLYRLLHVQRDAPAAVIKGSYRTLMQTLRKHPDLGGDEWDAQLLNEARRILCDPGARARYDATLASGSTDRSRPDRGAGRGDDRSDGRPPPRTASAAVRPDGDASAREGAPRCHYCKVAVAAPPGPRTAYCASPGRCHRCGAPTRAAVPAPDVSGGSERRGLHRIVDGAGITLQRHWPDNIVTNATLLEFSTTGCALVTDTGLPDGDTVLLRTRLFVATGKVCSSLPVESGAGYRTGIAFLGIEMHASPGAVFSASA